MATLTVQSTSRAGLDVAGTAADAAGDEWANTGVEMILIKNGGGSGITVTLDFKATPDGATVTDPTVSIGAGATKVIGPFPPAYYNDTSTGRAKATCSGVTSVTIVAFKPGATS
jgi:hypothetical protein